jgi:hypothetical protein
MEQSSENENTCDIFINEIKKKNKPLLEFQKNGNLQTEGSRNLEMNEEKMKNNFKKLHAQRSFWGANNINELCWAFYCVNDNKEVNITTPQTMHCIICHNNSLLNLN